MHWFYHPDLQINDEIVTLSKEESQHALKTLRLKEGALIGLLNGQGIKAHATLHDLERNSVNCQITNLEQISEPVKKVHLFIAPPRAKILSKLIKQMVELGVWSINLIESKYSVAKPDKIDNMKKDVIAACKQSTNPFAADVKEAQSFKQAVEQCQWPIIFGGIPTNNNTTSSQQDEEVALFIGPEGGFSQEEITLLLQKNAESIAIGRYILRTETAAVALLAILNK